MTQLHLAMAMADIDSDGDAAGFTFGEFSEIMRTQAAMDLDVETLDSAFSHAIPAHGHPSIPLYQQAHAGRARARVRRGGYDETTAPAAKRALAPGGDSRLFNSRMAVAQQLDSSKLQLVVMALILIDLAIVFTPPPLRPVAFF